MAVCKIGNAAPDTVLIDLPAYQAGAGRHKCVICAYRKGTSGLNKTGRTEKCAHGNTAPVAILEELHDSQAGLGRHKCAVCSFAAGELHASGATISTPFRDSVEPQDDIGDLIPLAQFQQAEERALYESHKSSTEAREMRLKSAPKQPTQVKIVSRAFIRNPDVVLTVLERANGKCEGCMRAAPFNRAKDGTPYLEVHHKVMLAQGGNDTVENAIALCPNCHRQRHYG